MDPILTILAASTVGAGAAATWGVTWKKVYHPTHIPLEVHHAVTTDGWKVALTRYQPEEKKHSRPILLCHGLSANRFTFDLAPEVSLARYLAERGFDVWVIELRGRGKSDKPKGLRKLWWNWAFDHYLHYDAPAAVEYILEAAQTDRLHWVGHSMGGILLYCYLAEGGTRYIQSGITVGSSLDYSQSPSGFHYLVPFRWLAKMIPLLPLGPATLLVSPFSGRRQNPIETFNYWLPNMDPKLVRRLNAIVKHSISPPVLAQLATAFSSGGLQSWDGDKYYLKGLEAVDTPVLALAGDKDLQCPPEAARLTVEVLGEPSRLKVCGKEGGHEEHYGHFDLLAGRNVCDEVYPSIARWVEKWDKERD